MSEEDKAALRKRLETADAVLDRIQKSHADPSAELSFEEYDQILRALTDPGVAPDKAVDTELTQARKELPNMRAAMDRKKSNNYEKLMVGDAGAAVTRAAAQRAKRREDWSKRFQAQLARSQGKGRDYVADLPEHCVKESAGERAVVWAGTACVIVQLISAYVALSLSFRLPMKGE
jgi:hypothetical protein